MIFDGEERATIAELCGHLDGSPLTTDAGSINRGLEDTLYLRRAHSVVRSRQHVNLIGWALMVNSLTLAEHRARPPDLLAAA